MNTIDEKNFGDIPVECYNRRAQIPINEERFNYLTKDEYVISPDGKWIIFNHPNYFCIYDNNSSDFIFKAEYEFLKKRKRVADEDILKVVVGNIVINRGYFRNVLLEEDEWRLLIKILLNEN